MPIILRVRHPQRAHHSHLVQVLLYPPSQAFRATARQIVIVLVNAMA